MVEKTPDFSGWATRYNRRCSDGLTILPNSFAHNDKEKVPLMWQHGHKDVNNLLGYAILHNRDEGVYADAYFNSTMNAEIAKEGVKHGDVNSLSIYANNIQKRGNDVYHGNIKEVSVVLSGANPDAYIDFINLAHEDGAPQEAIIYGFDEIEHSDTKPEEEPEVADKEESKDEAEETIGDVLDTMTDKQIAVLEYLVGEASAEANPDDGDDDNDNQKDVKQDDLDNGDALTHTQKAGTNMSRNVFDQNNKSGDSSSVLSHDQITTIIQDDRYGSLSKSVIAHAEDYGIENIDILFPEAKALTAQPEFIKRRTEWVQSVLGGAKHSPFARTKTILADITAEEARARGYAKGTMKKDEVIKLLKRTTEPTTVYKKQKLDRDDIIDITGFDVVVWLKGEMRLMLDEELARAALLGDGRNDNEEGKIRDPEGAVHGVGIRSILNDHEMYTHTVVVNNPDEDGAIVEAILRGRTYYRGTGNPTFFTTDAVLTDMLLEKDKVGRRLYKTVEELAAVLRVSAIVPVEVMEFYPEVLGIEVNMADYSFGADNGGQLSMFDDFDLDYNQQKYLIETRVSGALTRPKAALVFKRTVDAVAKPVNPSFNSATNTISLPNVPGVEYRVDDDIVTGDVVIEESTTVTAHPKPGYVFEPEIVTSWTFTYNE